MKNKLKKLFDYQRFENDKSLGALIDDTEKRRLNVRELSDDELGQINAAGELNFPQELLREIKKTKE